MQAPWIPDYEEERLVALYNLGLLDSEPEERFDRITRLAQSYFDFPVAMISLVDRDRQWFKSIVGVEAEELPRNTSFCGHAILQEEVFSIPDTRLDPRFADNPLVIGEPYIRAYYGIPLRAPDGYRVGTLCLIDHKPRELSAEHLDTLRDMAKMVEDKLALNNILRQAKLADNRQRRLNAILQTEMDAIVSIKSDGSIVGANPATQTLFGYEVDQLIGQSVDQLLVKPFFDPLNRTSDSKLEQKITQSASLREERMGVRMSGEIFPLELSLSQVDIDDEPQKILIMRDVSERKAYENQLGTLLERLRRSQEFAHIGSWEWDIQTENLFWSNGAADIFGFSPESMQLTIDEFTQRIHPDDQNKVAEAIKQCIEQRKTYDIEHRIIRADGQEYWVQERGDVVYNDQGQPERMLGVVIDIDAKKRAEVELHEHRRQLKQAQKRARLGHWRANLQTGELTWSKVIYEIFGIDPEIAPNVDLFMQAVHPGDRVLIDESHEAMRKTGVHDVVHRIVRPDGEVRIVHELAEMHMDSQGEPLYLIGTVQDVTELKQAEQDLLLQQTQLRKAIDKAEHASQAKTEFLSSMSHELRTPLNSILGFAQLLHKDQHLNELQKDSLNEIIQAGKHLLELINQILDFASIESGQVELNFESVSLNKILNECLSLLKPQAVNKKLELILDLPEEFKVKADRLRLKQVILNLMSNGIKYNQLAGKLKLQAKPNAEFVRLSVTDSGLGIPSEKIKELFTPFERLDKQGSAIEGSGIGLSISKTLVEQMAGEIGVESSTQAGSSGTTFWIDIPRVKP
ncbi:PAS domain S-box protein [Thiomicrospira pelophila]|uniref:sensor histidine kinase n=1 Tax=Thiomicrospira pelophila TaxID=934 RepID=UPI0004A74EBE|nr:PAS domain S-box protein [Thiomicrospira pelophila]